MNGDFILLTMNTFSFTIKEKSRNSNLKKSHLTVEFRKAQWKHGRIVKHIRYIVQIPCCRSDISFVEFRNIIIYCCTVCPNIPKSLCVSWSQWGLCAIFWRLPNESVMWSIVLSHLESQSVRGQICWEGKSSTQQCDGAALHQSPERSSVLLLHPCSAGGIKGI